MLRRAKSTIVFLVSMACAGGQSQSSENDSPSTFDALSLEKLLNTRVQTASLKKQSLQEAPASVTVITAEDIRRNGYRTLGEALANVRSFYLTSDGPMTFVGVRGFSLLGDYNTRFLVLINGHHLTDNVYGAMYYFGQDFPLDMDAVDQIEVVRGPSSALYGGNGIFATINIITQTPKTAPAERLSLELGTFGEQKLIASKSLSIGKDVKALFSASLLHAGGRTVEFPELAGGRSPSRTNYAGNESGYRMFADVTWKNWDVMALLGQHKSIVPTGWFGTEVGNTGTTDLESRNFIDAAWNHEIGSNGSVRWRTYYDQYRYDGIYDYGDSSRTFDGAYGDWIGSQLEYHYDNGGRATLTGGGEVNVDLRNVQYDFDTVGAQRQDNFRLSHPRTSYGFFAQEEFKLSSAWTAYLGGRIDATSYDSPFLSPRAAMVYKRGSTAYKIMYGRAFRNPSTYERYWEPNPALDAERINTFEVAREQRLHKRVNLITSVFHYRLSELIVGVPIGGVLQYQNAAKANATGLELAVNGQPTHWLEAAASFSIERTRGIDSSQKLQNSPVGLGQFRATVPLAHQRLLLSGAVRYLGSRLESDGGLVSAGTVVDLTATAVRLQPRADLQFGVRNLLNTVRSDPLSPEHTPHLMPAAARSIYVKLTWRHD